VGGMMKSYKVEDLFQDDPNDPDSLIFTIPEEICEELGLNPGDTIEWEADDGTLKFRKKEQTREEYEDIRAQKILDNPGFEVE
jgi:hypothetical protein